MQTNRVTLCVSIVSTIILLMIIPQVALADGTCTALVASKWNQAYPNGEWYNVELTMHREDVTFVSYSGGWLQPQPDGSFSGGLNQLFSDRWAGNQPFNINAADWLQVKLSPT